ncbi:secreted protein [Phakopsora pachyrhizi]|uniref:Secreted protein n=1 Tax=Phakopsora pachyrhizi TaxID=170000 RepID=A0AAV0BJU2_PHAPC|nr:secreted protein [Phakopsora pachyrhizi]CAH7687251.1 secreted protein [Phakopsora pachyrhizi]
MKFSIFTSLWALIFVSLSVYGLPGPSSPPSHDVSIPQPAKKNNTTSVPKPSITTAQDNSMKRNVISHLSRRSPLHPEVIKRQNILPRDSLLDATNLLGADRNAIHDSLLRLQNNKKLGLSTEYQKKLFAQLEEWQKHANSIPLISSFSSSLKPFGKDNRIEILDRKYDIQLILKTLVNTVKYTLKDLNLIFYLIPGLGKVLGPIFFQIKCIFEELLNAIENLTDGSINNLGITEHLKVCSLLSNLKEFC